MEKQDLNTNNINLRYDLKLNGNIIFEDPKDEQHLKGFIKNINDRFNRYGGKFKITKSFPWLTVQITLPSPNGLKEGMEKDNCEEFLRTYRKCLAEEGKMDKLLNEIIKLKDEVTQLKDEATR